MPPRRRRAESLADKRPLLKAMRACRSEAIRSSDTLRPFCDVWKEIHKLTEAIDRLAEHLIGDPRLFHAQGSTAQSGILNGVVRRD